MKLTKSEEERLYSTVTQEDRDYYRQKTGIEATDSYIKMFFLIYKEEKTLASLVGVKAGEVKPEEQVKKRLKDLADNWFRSELLFALEKDGYVIVNGDNIHIDPEKIAELQHYKGTLYANNTEMKSVLSYIIENSPKHETDEDKTNAIHHYINRLVKRYKNDEKEIQ